MARPYAFRYPFDVVATLAPWRDKLGENFEPVVALLTDRDRALEDHLSLGVAQGYLGIGVPSSPPVALTSTPTDIAGMSVTFTVPAGRRLKVTLYVHITNIDAAPRASFVQVLDENGTTLFTDSASHDNFGGSLGSGRTIHAVSFQSPAAGTHTYRLQANINGGAGSLVASSGNESFISIEDVGTAQ